MSKGIIPYYVRIYVYTDIIYTGLIKQLSTHLKIHLNTIKKTIQIFKSISSQRRRFAIFPSARRSFPDNSSAPASEKGKAPSAVVSKSWSAYFQETPYNNARPAPGYTAIWAIDF